jgi:hypothetical protein
MVYDHCDIVQMSYAVFNGYKVFYSRFIHNSRDIRFSSNLINCQECILCSDLNGASYCIENKQYTQEEYQTRKQDLLQQKDKFMERFGRVDRQGKNFGSTNVTGSCVINATEVEQSHSLYNIANGRNIYMSGAELDNQYIYDSLFIGALGGSHYYGTVDIA